MKIDVKKVAKLVRKEFRLRLKGKTAVFIDAANIERSLADLGVTLPRFKKVPKGVFWKAFPKGYWKVDYEKLYKYFKSNSQLIGISFYSARFNTDSHNQFLAFLKQKGYRLITKPVKRIKTNEGDFRKANFDVEISVDAVSWIKNYDTFILFSGDSDFGYLLNYLNRHDKRTVVISQRGHVSKELIKFSKQYIDIYKLRDFILRIKKQKSRT